MKLTENALKILEERYFRKDQEGKAIENWEGLVKRVAANIAGKDKVNYKKFYNLLDSLAFLPNSPTLMNAGNDLQQLSACFVLPIEDSMDSIFTTIKNAALIHKSGGGTGFSFSKLREANSRVLSTNGVSSGPLAFLQVFNSATNAVKQGGTRRGANMAILSIDHPDILDFITAKEKTTELTNFNISVGVTDAFMRAVQEDEEYDLISPRDKRVIQTLKARDVFAKIVKLAHKNGEPGIIFLDRINEYNPTPHIGSIESTNPCGEQPLLPNEACNLGSINLTVFYQNNQFDWDHLKQVVRDSVEFLDCVIDKNKFPLPEIEKIVQANRKIGLGVMGWAHLLYKMGIPYNSEEAISFAGDVMEFIDYYGKEKSMEMALEKGQFPNFKGSVYDKGTFKREKKNLDWDSLLKKIKKNGIRNATVTTIAPTGTISMLLETSGGIEPEFNLYYTKKVMDNKFLKYANKILEEAIKVRGIYTEQLMARILENEGIEGLSEIPDDIHKIFVTSHIIPVEWHIKMLATFQKYTDNAVSKTINLPNEATENDVKETYETAWKLGCKGLTVYRDGSREDQVLQVSKTQKIDESTSDDTKIKPRKRPEITSGITSKIETACGNLYVTVNCDELGPCEVFIQLGKVGGCASAQLEAMGRLVSTALRANVKLESIIRHLKGIRCPNPYRVKKEMIESCADGVARALETFLTLQNQGKINGGIKVNEIARFDSGKISLGEVCPYCGCTLRREQGCMVCPTMGCGFSRC
ncbi:MAG: vitamin B12-dependent ribonucleotide reductase [Candidatus Cloacimonetes bacterium]|nr:vitamin B12-dependent ribonucleotide reductase [Candidatus Cloacimonadota bacterium]